jgi:SH3-like domain-containing protein
VGVRFLIAATAVVAGVSASAFADPWKTTIDVVLRKKPGERQAVVTKLRAGTTIVIEREDGRWLRVRAGKHVGYLTRTTVADTAPAPVPPAITPTVVVDRPADPGEPVAAARGPSQRWSAARTEATRGGTTGLFVGVTAERATLLADARPDAAKISEAGRGTRLAVIDAANPAWIHVRDGEGRDGWITRGDVDSGSAAGVMPAAGEPAATVVASAPATAGSSPRKLAVRAGAALGYRSLGMDFTSNGASGLANYLVSADAAAAALEIDVSARLTGRVRVGVDGRLQVSTSSPGPGIDYLGPSRAGGKIPFSTFAVDGGVRVGVRARRVFEVAVRGGLHYDAFLAKDVENAGMLPREQLVGGTLGLRVDITPPTSRVDVGIRLDALVIGSRTQTPGLEDGTASDAGAVWAGATIRLRMRSHLAVFFAYDFARATTDWTGMSVRTPGVTEASRVDSSQLVQIGVGAEL